MNHIRRILATAATLVGTLLTFIATSSPASAMPPPGDPTETVQAPPQVHTIVTGGMPGWQIALIAVTTAVIAATTAVILDRARATRRGLPAPTA
jgi:hypothetical protein